MKLYHTSELRDLEAAFGPFRHERVEMTVSPQSEAFWHPMRAKNRRGEVVLVLQPKPGQVLVHTKTFYPAGVYRLPTGGILPGEPVLEALHREAVEETGLAVQPERFLGLVEYRFRRGDEETLFASWAFLLRPLEQGPARSQDAAEQISDFLAVPVEELRHIAAQLRSLPFPWADWGRFRAVVHDLVTR
ncbi:MAG: NUDIX hydrolase, partial [Anaerolineae bacterium]|nr:NUDIX hydrolase [Anaerolineae bacterium]